MLRHLESITVLRGGIPFIAVLLWVAVAVEPDPFASTRRNRVLKKLRPEVEIQAEAEAQESVDFVRSRHARTTTSTAPFLKLF